jgi:hypothetical protein
VCFNDNVGCSLILRIGVEKTDYASVWKKLTTNDDVSTLNSCTKKVPEGVRSIGSRHTRLQTGLACNAPCQQGERGTTSENRFAMRCPAEPGRLLVGLVVGGVRFAGVEI